MRRRSTTLLLATLALLGARCAASDAPPPQGEVAVRVALQDAAGHDAKRFEAGAPIHLRIELANPGAGNATLDFSSGRTHDAVILGEGGVPVWRWSEGRAFTQALTALELGPEETIGFSLVCDPAREGRPALPPGRYEAVAVIPSAGAELRSKPVRLEVR